MLACIGYIVPEYVRFPGKICQRFWFATRGLSASERGRERDRERENWPGGLTDPSCPGEEERERERERERQTERERVGDCVFFVRVCVCVHAI